MRPNLMLAGALTLTIAVTTTVIRPATAQITIDDSDLFALVGTTLTFAIDTTGQVAIDVGNSGANQTWDFSAMTVQGERIATAYLEPDDTPFASEFPGADVATRITSDVYINQVVYQYAEVTSTFYRGLGFVAITESDTTISTDEEDDLFTEVQIPITYGDSWTDVQRDTTEVDPTVYFINYDSTSSVVDAWGTLILPGGAFNALRVRANSVYISAFYLNGSLFSSDTSRTVGYDWFTREAIVAASAESGDNDPNFTTALYFQMLGDVTVGVDDADEVAADRDRANDTPMITSAWPNPFSESVTLSLDREVASGSAQSGETTQATVHDLLGRRIRVLDPPAPGPDATLVWDGRTDGGVAATAGVYFIRITNSDRTETRAVTKVSER